MENKDKEDIMKSARMALHKMEEKQKWAEKQARPIIAAICKPFIERDEYKRRNQHYFS